MADATVSSPAPRKRRGWLRILGWIVGVLIVLVIVAYFVGTSSAFFKGVILPKASKSLNAHITVSDASISPFREVVLHNLKVQTTGTEPLVTAPEVRAHYSLMDIIRGNIHVDELAISSPTVVVVENPDGTSNLDPILKAQKAPAPKPEKPAPPAKPSKPTQVDIKKIALTDATVRQIKLYKGGTRDVTELSHINVNVDNVKNGQSGKLALSGDIKTDNNPPPPGAKGLLEGKLNGNFTFALTPDLKPGSIQGNTRLGIDRAEGSLAQLATFGANFDCNITPTDIKQVALRFQKGDTSLGELRATGPFNMEKTEGRIRVELLGIDKRLLNLAGAQSGIDFGPTTINSTNDIQMAKSGSLITAAGRFNLNQLQLTRTNQTTPPLDLHADYDATVDSAASNAVLRAFTVNGAQKGTPVIHGELTSPMTISWGNVNQAVGDSALNLAVTHLNLADWQPFLGDFAPAGDVNMKLQLLSKQAGKQLTFDLSSEINNLTAGSGSNQITQATVTLAMRGQATNLKQFNFPEYKFQIARQNQPLLTASGSGTYDQDTESADMQLKAQVMLARLLQALPRPDVNVSSGNAEFNAHVTQKQKTQNVTGNFALADFTGKVGSNTFQSFGATADFDVGMTPEQVQIRKVAGKLTQGQNAGGTYNLTGTYDLNNKSGQLNAKLADFNQNGLRPFLEPMLADKKLVSVALNGNASAQYDPQGASAVKAGMQITNLVVNDPKGQFPATPLAAGMQVDASLAKQIATIRQCQLALTPTSRATNQIQLTGQVDMTQTNAIQGNLKLFADSLDLTSYYDLFGGKKPAAEQPSAAAKPQAAPAATPAAPEKEPEAKQLPFRNFVADANIRRLYLHEVEIADYVTTVKIDGGHVVVNPCKLALNGAPVNSVVDLDLGVPGYKYDVSFNAQAVPLPPLVNTFQPERKGQVGGTVTAQTKISGTGTTGASLQKTLAGQFDINSTNLNLSVVNVKNPLIKRVINVVATFPELIRNPAAGVSSLAEGLFSKGGGLTGDLAKSPIDAIIVRGNAGSGSVNLQQTTVRSPAFLAQANGLINLAPVLTNSPIQIPVSIWLSQPIAQRLGLPPDNSIPGYTKLPDFLTLVGTVGDPKEDIKKAPLLELAAKGIGGSLPVVGGTIGNVLQGLTGGGASTNTSTNQPPQNKSPLGGLLQKIPGLNKK